MDAFEDRFEIKDYETDEPVATAQSLAVAWELAVTAASGREHQVDIIDHSAHPGRRQMIGVSPQGDVVEERNRPGIDKVRARWASMTKEECHAKVPHLTSTVFAK